MKASLIIFLFLVGSVVSTLIGQTQYDRIELDSGETLKGTTEGTEAGFISLKINDGAGAVYRRINPSNIVSITFSDNDFFQEYRESPPKLLEDRIIILEAITKKRIPLIGNISEIDENSIIELIDLYVEAERSDEASEIAKISYPNIRFSQNRLRIEEQLIICSLATNALEQANVHARKWMEKSDSSQSAIAWHVIAESQYNEGEIETALWTSLYPIAKYQTPPPRYLNECYQTAIKSSRSLGLADYAERLDSELHFLQSGIVSRPMISVPSPMESPQVPASLLSPNTFDDLLKTNSYSKQ